MPETLPLLKYTGRPGLTVATVLGTKHSISSLAKATGYTKAHISRIFRRLEGPSDECLTRLARALKVPKAALAARLVKPRSER